LGLIGLIFFMGWPHGLLGRPFKELKNIYKKFLKIVLVKNKEF
jgi:hypothetical protein